MNFEASSVLTSHSRTKAAVYTCRPGIHVSWGLPEIVYPGVTLQREASIHHHAPNKKYRILVNVAISNIPRCLMRLCSVQFFHQFGSFFFGMSTIIQDNKTAWGEVPCLVGTRPYSNPVFTAFSPLPPVAVGDQPPLPRGDASTAPLHRTLRPAARHPPSAW